MSCLAPANLGGAVPSCSGCRRWQKSWRLDSVDFRHATSITPQGLHHSVNDGVVVDAGRRGAEGWLLCSTRQLIGVHELSRLGHRSGEVVAGGVEMEIFLKLDVEDAIDELSTKKRVRLGWLDVRLRPGLPV